MQANGFSGWNGGSLDVNYDNLRINANALVGYTTPNTVPGPSTLFLVAPFFTFINRKKFHSLALIFFASYLLIGHNNFSFAENQNEMNITDVDVLTGVWQWK